MGKHIKFALIQTIPVLFGYLFLGIAFGLMLQRAGYPFVWAGMSSMFIYAGSMQFVLIRMLGSNMDIISVILLTLSVNSRHIFYCLSFIQKFKVMGKRLPYMVFSMTDETYSLLCSVKVPLNLDEKKVFFYIAFLNHLYWILGGLTGSVIGELIQFNIQGIEFAMTALFVVIFIEQWLSDNKTSHFSALVGIGCGILARIVLGSDNFILPALILAVSILCFFKNRGTNKIRECD